MNFAYRESFLQHNRGFICLEVLLKLRHGEKEALEEVMKDRKLKRKRTQPLEYPSAGSTFKNPIGHSAGFLIEKSNLKGYSVNDAFVSDKHANFIINKGEASGDDIIKLIKIIKKKVKEDSNISLELEQEILE